MSLLWYDPVRLRFAPNAEEFPGLAAFYNIHKAMWSIMCDRTGSIRGPLRTCIDPAVLIPDPKKVPNKTFEECCYERTLELLDLSERVGKPLYIMFSGGIDSTMIMSAFLMHHPLQRLQERIVIVLSTDAWVENPNFVRTNLLGSFPMLSSSSSSHFYDGRGLIVDGEMNDYYLPNSQLKKLSAQSSSTTERGTQKYSMDVLFQYLTKCGLSDIDARIWTDIFDQDRTRAYVPIATLADMFWWIRFNWTRQAYKMLPIVGMNMLGGHICSSEEMNNRVHHFFDTPFFQVWAMKNTDRSPRKNHCRALIKSFTHDDEWVENKQKFNSLRSVLQNQRSILGIDENFSPITSFEKLLEFYNPDNDFIYGRVARS